MQKTLARQRDLRVVTEDQNETESKQLRLGPRDLRVIGKLWVFLIRAILACAKTCFIPTVRAAPPPNEPQRPPKMKYTDLPLYGCPAHVLYKEHQTDEIKCPGREEKILHNMVHPYVTEYREQFTSTFCTVKSGLSSTYTEVVGEFFSAQQNLKSYMQSPGNERRSQVAMALGTAAGYYFGAGGGVPRRFFCTGLGACAVGSICYPKETDEALRTFLSYVGKGALFGINLYCGKALSFKEQVTCPRDVPEIPPPNPKQNCPPKK